MCAIGRARSSVGAELRAKWKARHIGVVSAVVGTFRYVLARITLYALGEWRGVPGF